jgi:hypothetical protein
MYHFSAALYHHGQLHIFTWAISFARHYNYSKELSKHNMLSLHAFSGADRTSVFILGVVSYGGSDSATTQ